MIMTLTTMSISRDSNQLEPPKEWPKIYYKLGAVYKGRPPKSRNFKPPPSPCPGVSEFPKPHPSPDVRVRIFQFLHIFQFLQLLSGGQLSGVNCTGVQSTPPCRILLIRGIRKFLDN